MLTLGDPFRILSEKIIEFEGLLYQCELGGGTYFGFEAGLNDDLLGRYNVGIGYQALLNVKDGYYNAALGAHSLLANTDGFYNTAVGYQALTRNTTGHNNTAVGQNALRANTGGYYNTAMGVQALQANTGGYYNTAMGMYTLRYNTTGVRNIALGYMAGAYELESNAFYVNNQDRFNNTNEKLNSIIYGIMAELAADQKLTFNAAVTVNGRLGQIGLGGSTYFGFESGKVDDLTNNYNTGAGYQALKANTTGYQNVALGYIALLSHTIGGLNVAVGSQAFLSNINGLRNVGLGFSAGKYELESDKFYVNNQDRTDTAGDKAKSIIYGQMAALAADQRLTFNADVKIVGKTGLNNVAPVGKAAHIADPTDLATAITAINAILVVLENLGAVATA